MLQELLPRGGQRGKIFTLYLRGENLPPDAQIRSTLPASFSRLTLSKDPLSEAGSARPNSVLPFLVTLKPEAPTGFYPIRITSSEGISNVLLFSVGDLPEIEEAESRNPKLKDPQAIVVPAVVNGTLGAADIDTYVFQARAGQKLVFEVEARRMGSAIDPAIEITGPGGKELASNDDAPALGVDSRVEVAFARAGEYRVRVHDTKYSDQAQNFYRLKIGSYPYAEAIFPLGGRRGQPTRVTLSGGNLPKPVTVEAAEREIRVPGSPATPLPFVLSNLPEELEGAGRGGAPAAPGGLSGILRENTILNGRIGKPGEIDRYRLAVAPGEQWVIELRAASLGASRLDALLTLADAAGKKIERADDLAGPDPVLPFTAPAGATELVVAVEDLLGRGGEAYGYRLLARRQQPDFIAELATPFVNVPAGGTVQVVANIQRRGYDGPLELKIEGLPPGFHVAGGHVPSEAAAQRFNNDNAGRLTARGVMTLTADPGVKPQAFDARVVVVAETPDGRIERRAVAPGLVTPIRGVKEKPFTAPWLGMELAVATTSALPASLDIVTPLARFVQGFEFALEYRVRRAATFSAPVKVVAPQIAAMVGNIRILKGAPGKNADSGVFLINTNFATPLTTFDMLLEGQIEIDGKAVTLVAPALPIEVTQGYQVLLAQTSVEIAPGSKAEILGRVRREPTFQGDLVRIQMEDLPEGVHCPAVEVPGDRKEFRLVCEAAPAAAAGAFPVRISSVAPNTGASAKADYKIPDLTGRLVVSPAARASKD